MYICTKYIWRLFKNAYQQMTIDFKPLFASSGFFMQKINFLFFFIFCTL